MTSFLDGLQSALGTFAQSDVYGPLPPRWHIVMTGQAAHVLIGAALAFFPVRPLMLAIVAVAWVVKEVLGDIPNGGGAGIVWLDSVADLGFGLLGFRAVRRKGKTPDET
jgi:hypothetical protein